MIINHFINFSGNVRYLLKRVPILLSHLFFFLVLIKKTTLDLPETLILCLKALLNKLLTKLSMFAQLSPNSIWDLVKVRMLYLISYTFGMSYGRIRKLFKLRIAQLFANPLETALLTNLNCFQSLWYIAIILQSSKLIFNWKNSPSLLHQYLISFGLPFKRILKLLYFLITFGSGGVIIKFQIFDFLARILKHQVTLTFYDHIHVFGVTSFFDNYLLRVKVLQYDCIIQLSFVGLTECFKPW